jgi:hypothetical protein
MTRVRVEKKKREAVPTLQESTFSPGENIDLQEQDPRITENFSPGENRYMSEITEEQEEEGEEYTFLYWY